MDFYHVAAADPAIGSILRYPTRVCIHMGPVDELFERTRPTAYCSRNKAVFMIGLPSGSQAPDHQAFRLSGATATSGNIFKLKPSAAPSEHDYAWVGHLQFRFPNRGLRRLMATGKHRALIDPATHSMSCIEMAEAYWNHRHTARPKIEYIVEAAIVEAKVMAAIAPAAPLQQKTNPDKFSDGWCCKCACAPCSTSPDYVVPPEATPQ